MFSFFRKKSAPAPVAEPVAAPPIESLTPPSQLPLQVPSPHAVPAPAGRADAAAGEAKPTALVAAEAPLAPPEPPVSPGPEAAPEPAVRTGWLQKLTQGLRKTGSSIAQVFTGTRIDEALYEELESALLMADAGVAATEFLLQDLRRRVKDSRSTEPTQVKALLSAALTELLAPLQQNLVVGRSTPTVVMVVGVNGAGKTTTIGKLTRHLADSGASVLLAAGDTFRAAAREQLMAWAQRNDAAATGADRVDIVSQEGADPSSVCFDAVQAGRARGKDVVIVDTAGRLPTQLHLMEELKKVHRVLGKAMDAAPHEVLLVVDGNTGQNALAQVKAFDQALGLTGLVVTKLDGTAKGGVLAGIALWARERRGGDGAPKPIPVYFVGVGEGLADIQTFRADEFAQALLG